MAALYKKCLRTIVVFFSVLFGTLAQQDNFLQCPKDWSRYGIHCYRFFNIRHSWNTAAEVCRRYGSELVLITEYGQNNFSSSLAASGLRNMGQVAYWIGLKTVDDLSTNTLESAGSDFLPKYVGFWSWNQPRPQEGQCVLAHLIENTQSWQLAPCEALLPFMCQVKSCPKESFACSNGQCISSNWQCDGEDDCGDQSDETDCPDSCHFYLQSSGGSVQSPNYPNKYGSNSDCKWTLEGPVGSGIVLQFSDFETEANFDTVQILAGGRTEESSVSLITLSGKENLSSQPFVTGSNLMIIKFKSDSSVERKGFRASWKTEPINCGGALFAQSNPQLLTSPQYPDPYPGGLECVYLITAPQGQIITLEVVEMDLEPNKDYILVRDGAMPSDPLLSKLSGTSSSVPRFTMSTSNKIYLYLHTSFGDNRKGFAIRYRSGCEVEMVASSGNISSPAFGVVNYPSNQVCRYRVTRPEGGSISLKFTEFDVIEDDYVEVFDGTSAEQGVKLHPASGFSGRALPTLTLTASSGHMTLFFKSNPLHTASGWKASFSADCPHLAVGEGALASTRDTAFGTKVTFTCPIGHEFDNGEAKIETRCMQGGHWSTGPIPGCQERYCGSVPQIDNGFAVGATNVTYRGQATYQCYAGFAFPSGKPTERIHCAEDGQWRNLPVCLASSCPPLPETPHTSQLVLDGGGRSYGTVIRFSCEPGYRIIGVPVIVCATNGQWSAPPPKCERVQCHILPNIKNGFVVEPQKNYFYGDEARVQCHRGYKLQGSTVITCGTNETFISLPKCEDVDECSDTSCDSASTVCTNTAGGFFCKCKEGFDPNLDCRPVGDLGLSSGTIPLDSIRSSGTEARYNNDGVRLDSPVGWCGNVPREGENWIQVDLQAPTVVRGFRTKTVLRHDGSQAFPLTVTLQYTNDLTDIFRDYSNSEDQPAHFRLNGNGGSGVSVVNLPLPLEARYIRIVVMEYVTAPCLQLELMGCSRQECLDRNECSRNNGGCDQQCVNKPGNFSCLCNTGYELYSKNGTAGFYIPHSETGLKDRDVYTINKTCVPKMCPTLTNPDNGLLLTTKSVFHFGDIVSFHCNFGYVLEGSSTLLCTSSGAWNGTAPLCNYAQCTALADDPEQGLDIKIKENTSFVPFLENVTISCGEVGRPLHGSATANFRQCVYDPQEGSSDYWLSGSPPTCPRINCGHPPNTTGAAYGFYVDTRYRASFYFGCEETFSLAGKTNMNDNVIRCQEDGTWDFGDIRCEGPVCLDPGRPPDGMQKAVSYEQGSHVTFSCDRPGYVPYDTKPITCVKGADCKVIKPLGIASGSTLNFAINATSQRSNYEVTNVYLDSATGWCGQKEPFTYVTVDLGKIYRITSILVKGIVTNDVVGRPTELRFFYKVQESENFIVYFPNFNITSKNPENYGELAVSHLPLSVRARYVILGIVSYHKNPCLKFDLMGCEDTNEEVLLGYDHGYPLCVDKEPPRFTNCPTNPIVVSRSLTGLQPVNYTIPIAVDNSGHIARIEVNPVGFKPPIMTFKDTTIQYTAYDFNGNVAFCSVNITVPDNTPPKLKCPQSYVVELIEKQDSYKVNFNETRQLINTTDKSGPVSINLSPDSADIPIGSYRNVTVTATDRFGNQATCHFQVSVQASACVSWSLLPPSNGVVNCLPNEANNGFGCVATCNEGFRFTDGDQAKTYECANKQHWSPSSIIPDCVPEDIDQAFYDVVAEVNYRPGGAISQRCLSQYVSYVSTYYTSLNQALSQRCSAINVQMNISFQNTTIQTKTENQLAITYTLRIDPMVHQSLLYNLCGSTLGLIFDLSVPSTSTVIESILTINAQSVGGQCPGLQATQSTVTQGFLCDKGEVLNDGKDGKIPRCLHCPAGTYASDKMCKFCPRGYYQDITRQSSCKQCPDGTYTQTEGSKSLTDCVSACGFGSYSPTGLVPCLQCPSNTFAGLPPPDGFTECQRCPGNTFTYSPGAASNTECKARCPSGSYSETGLEPCSLCPANFYQPNEGETTCLECDANQQTVKSGALSREACVPVLCNNNVCQNGGICLIKNHQQTCYCPAGFSGQFCEVDMDECSSGPCYNGGTCIDRPQGFRCQCQQGYSGRQCQVEQNECRNTTCPERAMCQDLPGKNTFKCLCRSGYEGPSCNVTVNPCVAKGNPCNNGATCVPLQQGRFKCECPPGWTGTSCEQNIDDCAQNPCLLGANCTDLVNDFHCDCPPGFNGKRCHLKKDTCTSKPCIYGVCVDRLINHECICNPGWTGESCNIDIDDCRSNPCSNGGQCVDLVDGFLCQCDTGFTGSRCQHKIDECESLPCQNGGTCVDLLNGFICQCRPGYVGLQCEAEVDECVSSPCNPAGTDTCIDLDNMFQCICNPGYTGENCEININECASSPCRNDGICIDSVNGFKCQCSSGWSGDRCEIDIGGCDIHPCLNDARCIDLFQDYFCVCPSGTDGKQCQTSPNRCIGNPCMNDGICKDYGSGLNCSCPAKFSGIGCQYEYNACVDHVCQNGASCENVGEDYRCICPPGFTGRHCNEDIPDCTSTSCSPTATCIDLTNGFYCKCPFNLTGEDCRKTINIDYDLYINDDSRSSSVALATPFELGSNSLTVAFWVQYNKPEDLGTVFTLYSVASPHLPVDKKVLIQVDESGVFVSLFPNMNTSVFIPYLKNVPINDGQWHHIVLIWDGKKKTVTLITDTAVAQSVPEYINDKLLRNVTLPQYGWITLGAPMNEKNKAIVQKGFHGRISRVNIWGRPLDMTSEIPSQFRSCKNAAVIFDGLHLRWTGYDWVDGTVEREEPGMCGERICPTGLGGKSCHVIEKDKVPPVVTYCPPDMWVITQNMTAVINWKVPQFSDNLHSIRVIEHNGLQPGQTLLRGVYNLAYVATDEAGNTAQCDFHIHVLSEFCPVPLPPVGGQRHCSDWGPNGSFKACKISCDEGLEFSQPVADFYTCGAEGFWRPTSDLGTHFIFPACAPKSPAQRIFRVALTFPTTVVCSESGKKILRGRVIDSLLQMNRDWHVCTDASPGVCSNLMVNVVCNKRGRVSRQINDDEIYIVEIAFPAENDPVTNVKTQEKSSVKKVVEMTILQDSAFDVRNTLPNVKPDLTSLTMVTEYACPLGKVVVPPNCVDCSQGTYYNNATLSCLSCPIGTYQNEIGQLFCKSCPKIAGQQGVTASTGARSSNECKERCSAGKYYDETVGLCRPCGYGLYQPQEGSFNCIPCGPSLTTRSSTAVSQAECRGECSAGLQLSSSLNCEPCPQGFYRTLGMAACEQCPRGRTTASVGSTNRSDCSLEVCNPGHFLNTTLNRCIACPKGTYQDKEQRDFSCQPCPSDTTTDGSGATSEQACFNPCFVDGPMRPCQANAFCVFRQETDTYSCECIPNYRLNKETGECINICDNYCDNGGTCVAIPESNEPKCECLTNFYGDKCEKKSDFVYIAGGIAGAVIFIILLVLFVWMICVRSSWKRKSKKVPPPQPPMDFTGSQTNILYGAPAPYAESIAPSHHSTYAHYYDDDDDGWEMPNFYNETYMKEGLHNGKTNSLARSNASLYGTKDDLYDRLRRHQYQGKKGDTSDSEDQGQL
ncbi:uncharacterized protein LOC106465521 [Limulus polyphemus]|uniref:Uncharacterized protein LOC106465521 n=1 Tax=Limulus polyphemus TaxID=6850 RepID=A0ABM1BFY9_LIMPO|nr:uncharacterized protein LOC106465521 [Limulus polyphemus]